MSLKAIQAVYKQVRMCRNRLEFVRDKLLDSSTTAAAMDEPALRSELEHHARLLNGIIRKLDEQTGHLPQGEE